jgi:hypothetical protein
MTVIHNFGKYFLAKSMAKLEMQHTHLKAHGTYVCLSLSDGGICTTVTGKEQVNFHIL